MAQQTHSTQHDSYAADYDNQARAYNCFIGDVLFGLCYEYIQPGMKLLDAGIGSGLSALPFAKAGLEVYGMDFSLAMLEICRAKRLAADLKQRDLQQVPWPYSPAFFDVLVCCGVMHFIPELENIFSEARQVLREGGVFAFTTKVTVLEEDERQAYTRQIVGGFEIFSHSSDYLESLLQKHTFQRLKVQKCFVSEDIFSLWVVQKIQRS